MKPAERQRRVAAMIAERGELSVGTLAGHFAVSAETIRRDLASLSDSGLVQKVHGGARAPRMHEEGSFGERMAEDASAKQIIAQKLLSVIEPGQTVFIDTGTTTLVCAEALTVVPRLTAITNSVRVARVLSRGQQARVLLLGGNYAFDNAQTVGPETIRQIASFRADRAILTPAGIDAEAGAMDADPDEAQVARAMHENARGTIIVAAASKFDRNAAYRVCRLDEIDTLVTESPPKGRVAALLQRAGVKTI